jgi:signal transduction histidine kinase/DNA-binding response OmpR family regulator
MQPPTFRLGLRLKITAYISLMVILTATVLGWFLVRRQAREISGHLKEKGEFLGRHTALLSEYGVVTGDETMFDSIIAGLTEEEDVVYCIISDNHGEILARTSKLPHSIEGISDSFAYGVAENALKTDQLLIQSFTRDEAKTPVYDIAAPIVTQKMNTPLSGEEVILGISDEPMTEGTSEKIGVARVGISLDSMNEEISRASRTIRNVTVTVVLLAIGMTVFLVGLIVNPVQQLVAATERVASGDLDKPVVISTNDEIGELGQSFNKMTQDLKRYRIELEEYSRTLEQKVEERTKALRLINEELHRTNQQLETVSKLKSEFLANMSHELRTPLNAIIGFSEILCDQSFGPLKQKQLKYAQNVVTSGKHLLQLINEILDLAKVESGKMELHTETFRLADVLAEISSFGRGLAAKKGITIRQHISPRTVTITADPKKVKQIFYNLISNAIKFTPVGGLVEISTAMVGDFEASEDDQFVVRRYVEFCVRDTGIGIEQADQERIFHEFQQVDGSYSRQYEGTGLGLSLTKKLVELHGGSIWLESEKDKGTSVYFTIPMTEKDITEPQAISHPKEARTSPRETGRAKDRNVVLVVEDDPHSFELISTYLQEAGYRVVHAATGEEVLDKVRSTQPAIITLDIILPDKGGWKILEELKASPDTCHIPVVITSVLQDEETGFSLGAADYIVKPVSRQDLIARLERLRAVTGGTQISRVLVVDNDKKFVDLMTATLEGQSFSVARAYTGLQGIEYASKQRPDLIFLDLMLPDISGLEVVEFLKMEESTKDIPIIVVTAKDLTEEEKRSLNGSIETIAQKGRSGKDDLLQEIKRVERLATTRKDTS